MDRTDTEEEVQFPAGLRVLVVDDDVTCLRVLKAMLLKCRYEGEQLLKNYSFFYLVGSFRFGELAGLAVISCF